MNALVIPEREGTSPQRALGVTSLRHHAVQRLVEAILRECTDVTVQAANVTANGAALDVRVGIATSAAALPARLEGLADHLRGRLGDLAGVRALTLTVEVTELLRR